jgi:hypothetical protein
MITQLQLEIPGATTNAPEAVSVLNGYTIRRVTARRIAIYNPGGYFVCHISSDDDPQDVIATDQAHHARLAPAAPTMEQRRRRNPKALGSSHKPAPPDAAPRGDLFREQAEKERAAATVSQPDMHTPEDDRALAYYRLANSAVFTDKKNTGRRKLRGPVDCLRRNTTSNRRAEFDAWLRNQGVKGASMEVRYASLLSRISDDIDDIALDFGYTADIHRTGTLSDPTKDVRAQLERVCMDIAELPTLFREMESLLTHLKYTKRFAVCPPSPLSPEEKRALSEKAAKAERAPRVEQSHTYLRELAWEKRSDTDIRYGRRWISLESMVTMIEDDLTGYANVKPLWVAIPSVDQLAEDYHISRPDARRVLAAMNKPGS